MYCSCNTRVYTKDLFLIYIYFFVKDLIAKQIDVTSTIIVERFYEVETVA